VRVIFNSSRITVGFDKHTCIFFILFLYVSKVRVKLWTPIYSKILYVFDYLQNELLIWWWRYVPNILGSEISNDKMFKLWRLSIYCCEFISRVLSCDAINNMCLSILLWILIERSMLYRYRISAVIFCEILQTRIMLKHVACEQG
jgi:hypothetical protein